MPESWFTGVADKPRVGEGGTGKLLINGYRVQFCKPDDGDG